MKNKLELVSFKLCPFVQRSVITLLHKKVDFDITYIDLANKPDWFLEISPLGKVPLLKVGDSILFESAVINEYIDETTPPSLHLEDSLQRAQNRSWIEFGSALIMSMAQYLYSTDAAQGKEKESALLKNLERVETILGAGPFFNGASFSLVDTAYAPVFMRLAALEKVYSITLLQSFPQLQKWSRSLLDLEAVQKSVVANFEELFISALKSKKSFLVS